MPRLAEYLQQLDTADAAEPGTAALTKTELAAKIAALQEKQDWHKECWRNWTMSRNKSR